MQMNDLNNCIELYGRDIYSFCCYLTRSREEADDLYQDTFLTATEIVGRLDTSGNPKSALLSVAVNLWRNRCRKLSLRQRITGPVISLDFLREKGGLHTSTAMWDSGGRQAEGGGTSGGGSSDGKLPSDPSAGTLSGGEPASGISADAPSGGNPVSGTSAGTLSGAFFSAFSGGEPASGSPGPLDEVIAREEARAVRRAVAALPDRYRLPVLLFYMEDLTIPETAAALRIPQGTVKSRLHKAKKLLAQELKEVFDET